MDKEFIAKAIGETLEKALPEAVEAVVDAKMADVSAEVKKSGEDLKKQIEDLSVAVRMGSGDEGKKDLFSKTARFFKSMVKRAPDFAEAKAAFLNEGTDSEGGYLVPTEFAKEVLRVAREVGFARRYCRIVPMSTDKKDISKIISGVTVYWTAEGTAATKSKPGFGVVELIANKITALVSGTNELIDDNQSDEEVFNLVRDLIGEAMAAFEDNQVLNGDGTGKNFTGIFVDTNVPTVTAAAATSFGAITYKDLVKVKNSVPVKYRRRPGAKLAWAMSQDAYTAIEGLVDDNGRPVIRESTVEGTDVAKLLGYPIEIVESAPATDGADKQMLAFGDWQGFILGDRKTLSFEIGYAQGDWEADIQSLKANERIAGEMAFADAFSILKTHA